MTYTVSSGTLNSTIPYYHEYCQLEFILFFCTPCHAVHDSMPHPRVSGRELSGIVAAELSLSYETLLQYFDTVGWVEGRASAFMSVSVLLVMIYWS